jgi:hypothetical protein
VSKREREREREKERQENPMRFARHALGKIAIDRAESTLLGSESKRTSARTRVSLPLPPSPPPHSLTHSLTHSLAGLSSTSLGEILTRGAPERPPLCRPFGDLIKRRRDRSVSSQRGFSLSLSLSLPLSLSFSLSCGRIPTGCIGFLRSASA